VSGAVPLKKWLPSHSSQGANSKGQFHCIKYQQICKLIKASASIYSESANIDTAL